MPNPMIRIHDIESGEVIDRPMTAAEATEYKKQQDEAIANQLAETAKAEAKASALAKLAALGLTDDEAKALLG